MKAPMYINTNAESERYHKHCKQLLNEKILSIKQRKKPFFYENNDTTKNLSETKLRAQKFASLCNLSI